MHEIQPVTSSPDHGDRGTIETHPAFGMISAHRLSIGPPGATLFDSDIKHSATVRVTINTAARRRDLKQDWLHSRDELIEVEMSEAQWASFVSSMNTSGVPCTLRSRETERDIPGLPYAPRLAVTMEETRRAAADMFVEALAALEELEEAITTGGVKARRDALRTLKIKLQNSAPNVTFAGKQLTEQAENVVQRARADIEAMVTNRAAQLGIEANTLELEAGLPAIEAPDVIDAEVIDP